MKRVMIVAVIVAAMLAGCDTTMTEDNSDHLEQSRPEDQSSALRVGGSISSNGVTITLDSIHWYQYIGYGGYINETDHIILQFTTTNNSGEDIVRNFLRPWGTLTEYPSGNQVEPVSYLPVDDSNFDEFRRMSILDGMSVKDGSPSDEVSPDSISFLFRGRTPYEYKNRAELVFEEFEVVFDRSDIVEIPVSRE